MRGILFAGLLLLAASPACAGSREVLYGPAPDWVLSPPEPTTAAAPSGAPARFIYLDQQVQIAPDGARTYQSYRIKILTSQALSIGNINAIWSPNSDDITIHSLKIIRGDQVIDVLADNRFKVIQRENNLESAMLDGQLTANLQAPGLRVGDIVEFSATTHRRDPNLGDESMGMLQLPIASALGSYRVRLVWPQGRSVKWAASADLAGSKPVAHDGLQDLVVELKDPKSAVLTEGAPARYNIRRLVEYSTYADWSDVSKRVAPMFVKAATLAANSPVRAEARKIKQAASSPRARAEAALKLVQDEVRYVYVGMDGGNYKPASADETWERRFGDCKAKTVLLLALLKELDIPADAVLVNSAGGDGIDQRLATPGVFDHVLVRATLDGETYWLDGTRLGDRKLEAIPSPPFRWGLPLTASASAKLQPLSQKTPSAPLSILVLNQDASAGFDQPAKVRAQQVVRGDEAYLMRSQLAALSPDDADRTLVQYWRQRVDADMSKVSWKYDENERLLLLDGEGEGKLDWDKEDDGTRSYRLPGAGFTPPDELRRPKEQDQAAPWMTEDYPIFSCWVTNVKLPPLQDKAWDYVSRGVDRQLGGVHYARIAGLERGVMHTVMSKQTLEPEITADEAKELNDALSGFDNKISFVYQIPKGQRLSNTIPDALASFLAALPDVDWTQPRNPCVMPLPPVRAAR